MSTPSKSIPEAVLEQHSGHLRKNRGLNRRMDSSKMEGREGLRPSRP